MLLIRFILEISHTWPFPENICNIHNSQNTIDWLVGFNVKLELLSVLLPTVWDSTLRIIRRHAIKIMIRHGGDSTPVVVPPQV